MRAIAVGILMCVTHSAVASGLSALPLYCDSEYRKRSPWTQGLALHHYCSALDHMNKYYSATTKGSRAWHMVHAMSEFNYVLKNPDPARNPILAEQYLNRGMALKATNKNTEAMKDWYRALDLDPKLSAAYLKLAGFFSEYKQAEKALEIVTLGLRYTPDHKALQRRYEELGGKLPYPKPMLEQPAQVQGKSLEKDGERSGNPDATTQATAATSSPAAPTTEKKFPNPVAPPGKVRGTEDNPYCRFCP